MIFTKKDLMEAICDQILTLRHEAGGTRNLQSRVEIERRIAALHVVHRLIMRTDETMIADLQK
jgi:hypothetical protein